MTGTGLRWIHHRRRRSSSRVRAPHDETAYLLASPANARRIFAALAELDAGGGTRITSVDDLARSVGL